MGLYFRKRRSLFGNLLRFSLTGTGLGVSLGVKGFRTGISSSGRRYVSASLPGTAGVLQALRQAERKCEAARRAKAGDDLLILPVRSPHRHLQMLRCSIRFITRYTTRRTTWAMHSD